MRLTVLGHASVLVETAATGVLIDPVFDEVFASGTLCQHPPRELDVDSLIARTTGIVVTHIHLDHYHPPTLARFSPDVPIVVPDHAPLIAALRASGHSQVRPLKAWERLRIGDLELMATPSSFELDEFGIVCQTAEGSYWHMSDAIVDAGVGVEVRKQVQALALASMKYQPLRTLIAYQRGIGAAMLDRDDLIGTFDAACAAAPACLFPYYSGFAFHGEHAWANRHLSPYDGAMIAALMRRRADAPGAVVTVAPGDECEIDGDLIWHPAASRLVRALPAPPLQAWEPIDPGTLPGVDSLQSLLALTLNLRRVLADEVLPWVQAHLDAASGMFDAYREYQVIWQCVVHVDAHRRLHHVIDFRGARAKLSLDATHAGAHVFTHVAGRFLHQVLRREVGAEVFWMAGAYRIYEKILYLKDGRIHAPTESTWALYDRLPDPLTHYLRRGRR